MQSVADAALLVGVDIGTTFCKAAVVSPDGCEVGHGRARTPWKNGDEGTEIDPGAFVDTATHAVMDALRGIEGRVVGLGITSMAETGVLVDEHGSPVVPSVAWHDPRGAEQARRIAELLGGGRTAAITGVPVGPKTSFAKYLWMRDTRPEAARGRLWLSVAEWVAHSLGARAVAELSLASRTGWLDIAQGRWWEEGLRAFQIEPALLPEPVQAGAPLGRAGADLGRIRGAVLTVGGHDHLCAAVGAGALREGDVLDSCGTAEGFVRSSKRLPDVELCTRNGVTVSRHVLPGRFALLGGLRSGLILERSFEALGIQSPSERRKLDAEALQLPPSPPEVVEALRLPVHGGFHDVPPGMSAAELRRAVLDSVVARGKHAMEVIESQAGPATRIIVTGGGTESSAFMTLKKRSLGDLLQPDVVEAGARGAALLAGVAQGTYRDVFDVPVPALRPLSSPGENRGGVLR